MTTAKQHRGRPIPADYWDRVSVRYDRQLWLESASVRCLLDLAAPTPHATVLDVATGTGAVLRILAARPSPPRQVVGVDRSQAMLERVPPLPDGWTTIRADARELPFADCTFDLVTASYLLHVLDDIDRAGVLNEAHRVLRHDGVIGVLTPAIPPRGPLRPVARALNQLAARAPEHFAGLRALDPSASLSKAGFEILRTRHTARGYIAMCTLAKRAQDGPNVGEESPNRCSLEAGAGSTSRRATRSLV